MSTDGQGTKWHRNIAKNFNQMSRVHKRYRQTYRWQIDDWWTGDSIYGTWTWVHIR